MSHDRLLYETHFPGLTLRKRGKVRDLYDLGENLLIVATDRLSAYDVVFPDPIPFKGKVLTQMSNFWFEMVGPLVRNHIVSTRVEDFPPECREFAPVLRGRSVLARKAEPLPIECVARGYLSGSAWNEYRQSQSVCGIRLPAGLAESARLSEPLFTPATKAESGHDENIDAETAARIVGNEYLAKARELTLAIYAKASEFAEKKGIIIADTKLEFGVLHNEIVLIDEILTPDSSRFWRLENYSPGRAQESFDKQFVRNYLLSIGFSMKPPAPRLPSHVVEKMSELYREALRMVTGKDVE